MHKFWKRLGKRMARLWENVRRGSVADIAVLVSGVALVGALVTVFVVQMLPKTPSPDKNGADASLSMGASSASSASEAASSASGNGTVNPFGAVSGASSAASSKAASSASKKPASSSSKKAVASSSSKAVSSSSASSSATPATSTTTTSTTTTSTTTTSTTPSSSSSVAPHSHTYGEWTRVGADCIATTDERVCTGCGEKETREAAIIAEHDWQEQSTIVDEETGKILSTTYLCPKCGSTRVQESTD